MSKPIIGTLIRCANVDERRIAYYHEIGLEAVQIAGVYEEWLGPSEEAVKASDAIFALFKKYGISVPTMFLSFPDQDWSHPQTGVGLVPENTRTKRMLLACRQMNWAKRYGITLITCHAGFLSAAGSDAYAKFIAEMKLLAKFAASNGQTFLFETGTEKVAVMEQILKDIGEPNTGINFDPANLLIYNMDDPSVLVDKLTDRIKVIHCKDARRPVQDEVKGKETVLGKGETRFTELLKRMLDSGFNGPLIIERELPLGPEQEKDIADAVKLIQSVVG